MFTRQVTPASRLEGNRINRKTTIEAQSLRVGAATSWSLDRKGKTMPPLFILLAGLFMWGVLMEVLQRLMANGRGMDVLDMLANLAGAVAGLFVYKYLNRKWALQRVKS